METVGDARQERIRYCFIGRVQHRGFRFACVTCAEGTGVTGWVRNERDGTVTVEAQGTAEEHRAFLARLCDLVPGYAYDWSIGLERRRPVCTGAQGFAVRR